MALREIVLILCCVSCVKQKPFAALSPGFVDNTSGFALPAAKEFLADARSLGYSDETILNGRQVVLNELNEKDASLQETLSQQEPSAKGKILATCAKAKDNSSGQTVVVAFRKQAFANDDYVTKAIIYHELGHCILDREHTKSLNSLMRSTAFLPGEIRGKAHWQQLVKELFNPTHLP